MPPSSDSLESARALISSGQRNAAIEKLQTLAAASHDSDVLHQAGDLLQTLGELPAAVQCYRRALLGGPRVATLNNLGVALKNLGQPQAALDAFCAAREYGPVPPSVLNNIGNLSRQTGDLDAALGAYEACLAMRPDDADTLNNYAAALLDARRWDDAISAYDRALSSNPDHVAASGRLYSMQFLPGITAERLAAEHNAWGDRYAALATAVPHDHDCSPIRRLRIGLLSPNFEHHSVGRFLLPLVENLDKSALEIFCYSDVARPDAATARFQSAANHWRPTLGMDDAAVAAVIRDDAIDILIDLSLHLSGTRLKTFARRPAPVQATHLAYCGTSGLAAMDFRLTDTHLDPPGAANAFREQPMPLNSYWCYPPPPEASQVRPPPSQQNGYVTFGCLNNFRKISPPALAAWCDVLAAVPRSRLIVHSHTGAHRGVMRLAIADRGIGPDRLIFQGFMCFADYLSSYAAIDIALDTFPCNGGTTTCDALWMGVPVITLAGEMPTARSGVSILNTIGLGECVAADPADYLRVAVKLANEPSRLTELRTTMRQRMLRSPLMYAQQAADDFAAACRRMWINSLSGKYTGVETVPILLP